MKAKMHQLIESIGKSNLGLKEKECHQALITIGSLPMEEAILASQTHNSLQVYHF